VDGADGGSVLAGILGTDAFDGEGERVDQLEEWQVREEGEIGAQSGDRLLTRAVQFKGTVRWAGVG
jgi:hypothetical protein